MTRLGERLSKIRFVTELKAQTAGPGAMEHLPHQHTYQRAPKRTRQHTAGRDIKTRQENTK